MRNGPQETGRGTQAEDTAAGIGSTPLSPPVRSRTSAWSHQHPDIPIRTPAPQRRDQIAATRAGRTAPASGDQNPNSHGRGSYARDKASRVGGPLSTPARMASTGRCPRDRQSRSGAPMGHRRSIPGTDGMQRATCTGLTDCRIVRLRQGLGCFCNRPRLCRLSAEPAAGSTGLTVLRDRPVCLDVSGEPDGRTGKSCLDAPRASGPAKAALSRYSGSGRTSTVPSV